MQANKIRSAFERHQERQKCLNLCNQVLELVTHVQQHRGTTLAILAGDDFFESRLSIIKPAVLKSLQEVQTLRANFINNNDWETLCAEWFTVNYHWRQDNVFHNFELHTHLIQKLTKLFKDFCERPTFQNLDTRFAPLATLTLQELPELMETTAQIRGIGTHCLASEKSDKAFTDRLGFLSRYFSRITDHLNAIYAIDELLQNQAPWQNIMTSWTIIDAQISAGLNNVSNLTADNFFSNSSLLVFQIRQCIKSGIKHLRNACDTDIEQWIQNSSKTPAKLKRA